MDRARTGTRPAAARARSRPGRAHAAGYPSRARSRPGCARMDGAKLRRNVRSRSRKDASKDGNACSRSTRS